MDAPTSRITSDTEFEATASDSGARRATDRRARILRFVTVVMLILLAANGFVVATWNHFWNLPAVSGWEMATLGLTLAFVATTILGRFYSNAGLRLAYQVSAAWLGVLNYLFFAACASWIVGGATALLAISIEPRFIVAALFGGAILTSIYGMLNASWLRVTKVTVKLAHLPEHWRDRTIALVTDMHLGNVRGAGLSRRVVAKLNQLRPEAVLISGDLFDGSTADLDAMMEPWKKCSVPGGVYFVTGNHEEFSSRANFIKAVESAGIRVLNNEKVELDGLQMVGVHDGEAQNPITLREHLQRAALDRGRPSILLSHQPSNLAIAEEEGISLQVSGHTHGGQIWPWTWVAARTHGPFNQGLNRLGGLQVLTSNGVGTWGPPLRVATRSELVLVQLEPENS